MKHHSLHKHLCLRLGGLLLLAGLVVPCPAWAGLSGMMEWNWADYSHDVDGQKERKASHFYQKYSVLYSTQGVINDARAGHWKGALGYEWSALDTEFDGEDRDVDTGKLLYQGELLFAPGGLPLRLRAFSYDMTTVTMDRWQAADDLLIDPEIATELDNGQHIVSGFTLVAGIRNGTYQGNYRELLSKLPRLFIDYRETLVKDTERLDPVHYRMRDLAFVSLNKKDNWAHYRVTEYKDYENPDEDYRERQYLLGTIDHLGRRQWIHLTNWIQLSVDGSLTLTDNLRFNSSQFDETYAFNLFTLARRHEQQVANFTSMVRESNKSGSTRKTLDVPVYAEGRIDPQTLWRLQLIGVSQRYEPLAVSDSLDEDEDDIYTKFQLESTRWHGWTFFPEMAMEIKRGNQGKGQGAEIGFELFTDQRYRQPRNWLLGYTLRWLDGEGEAGGSVSYVEQAAKLSVEERLPSGMLVGGRQSLVYGAGDLEGNSLEYIGAMGAQRLTNYYGTSEDFTDESTFRSTSEVYLEIPGPGRAGNRISALYDYADTGSLSEHYASLTHVLTFRGQKMSLESRSVFEEGDLFIYAENSGYEVGSNSMRIGDPRMGFEHRTRVDYTPNRHWQLRGDVNYSWAKGSEDSGQLLTIAQQLRYSVFRSTSYARRYLALTQSFDYEKLWADDYEWYSELTCAADYYPTRALSFGLEVEYQYYGITEQGQVGYSIYSAFQYPKFQARVSYQYARRESGDFYPQARDQRWEIGIRKIF